MSARTRSTARLRRGARAAATLPVVAAALLAPAAPASAATEVYRSTFRGEFVSGTATSTDGCTTSTSGMDASASSVSFFRSTTNTCTGQSAFTTGQAAPTTFEMARDTAHLVATVALTNGDVVHIDNTWTATSKEPRWHAEPVVLDFPGQYRLTERGWTRMLTASVSGTVPLDSATMTTSGFTTMAVVHG